MYIDRIIKREVLTLIVSIVSVFVVIGGLSYAAIYDKEETHKNIINVGDLEISFCNDNTCESNYENIGQVIGMKEVDGYSIPSKIYPFESNEEALKTNPYIFNIKNTGKLKTLIDIRLIEEESPSIGSEYSSFKSITKDYPDNLLIGISDCTKEIDREYVSVKKYSEIENNIILSDELLSYNETKTYCLWVWLDNNTPNDAQNTYFIANLDFQAKYIPNEE